jgi:hypothetical protein
MGSTPEDMQRRLDDLEENIDRAREQAEADGLLPEDDADERKPTLADPDPEHSGDEELPGDATG